MDKSFSANMDMMLDAAKKFASFGWYVFPVHSVANDGNCTCRIVDCSKKAKHPVNKGWQQQCTIDPTKIEQWWNYKEPYVYNIGIATGKTSGITVVDIDQKNGGLETWANICSKIDIPDTFTVNTGGGGYHLYFKYCPQLRTVTDGLGSGIDIRNDGGYVLAPPSLHASMKRYEISGGVWPEKPTLAEIPEKLLTFKSAGKKNTAHSNPKETLSLEKAESLLKFISSASYSTWFNVGIILGRCLNRSDEGFELYQRWSDKDWDGKGGKTRMSTMKDAYYKVSQEPSTTEKELGLGTLYNLAYHGGYTDINNTFDIHLFCYLASANAFVFLPNGDKWVASGIDGTVPPVIENGEVIKASKWLISNRAAISLVSDGGLPNGLIDGYFSNDGQICKLPNSRIINLFNSGFILPIGCLCSALPTNEPKPMTKLEVKQVVNSEPKPAAKLTPVQTNNPPKPAPTKVLPKIVKKPVINETKVVYDAPAFMMEIFKNEPKSGV